MQIDMNAKEGYADSNRDIQGKMKNGHLIIFALARYKISKKSAVMAGLDQPLTQHPTNIPRPNIAFGFETMTSAHAFRIFAGNYYGICLRATLCLIRTITREAPFCSPYFP